MQPHRHHRSAVGLSCVLAAWTSLPAPVLPPETEETLDPAGRRRTGLARAGRHFSACLAGYQPAPKSADPRTCTGRQCTHRHANDSQDRPKERAETAKASSGGQDTKQRPQRLLGGEKPELGVPEPTGRPPHPFVAPVARPSHRTKRITAVGRPQADPPAPARRWRAREPAQDIASKTAVRLHPNHSHKAAPTPPTFSVVAVGRPQALISSA